MTTAPVKDEDGTVAPPDKHAVAALGALREALPRSLQNKTEHLTHVYDLWQWLCNVYAPSTYTTTVQARKIVCNRTFDRTSCTSILIAVDFHSIFSQTGTAKLDDACRDQPNLQYITTSVRRLRATTIV